MDLADGGALLEGTTRLMPGTRIVLVLRDADRSVAVGCEVVRCEVAALDAERGIRYRGAVRFDRPCGLSQ